MGTRGLIGWITPDGEVQGFYNHFDSYPSGVGVELQKELSDTGLDLIKAKIADLVWVTDDTPITTEDVSRARQMGLTNTGVSTGRDWYSVMRETQGSFLKPLEYGKAENSGEFIKDSLFCEWAYLIDFRSDELVILEGFNQDPDGQAPYAVKERDPDEEGRPSDTYYGCREVWRGSRAHFVALDMEAFEGEEEEEVDV